MPSMHFGDAPFTQLDDITFSPSRRLPCGPFNVLIAGRGSIWVIGGEVPALLRALPPLGHSSQLEQPGCGQVASRHSLGVLQKTGTAVLRIQTILKQLLACHWGLHRAEQSSTCHLDSGPPATQELFWAP